MENNWKIIASSVEEFEEIEEKLKKLPFAVREKIEIAEKKSALRVYCMQT